MEKEYLLGAPIVNLGKFIGACNAALGRNAVTSAGNDGLISAVNLTPTELDFIRKVNNGTYGVETIDTINLRSLTPAQIDGYIDSNVTDMASARAFLKRLSKLVALTYRSIEE